jgi:hypothetical protein
MSIRAYGIDEILHTDFPIFHTSIIIITIGISATARTAQLVSGFMEYARDDYHDQVAIRERTLPRSTLASQIDKVTSMRSMKLGTARGRAVLQAMYIVSKKHQLGLERVSLLVMLWSLDPVPGKDT